MLPNTKARIDSSLDDLKNYMLEQEEFMEELAELEEWTLANTQVDDSAKFLETI